MLCTACAEREQLEAVLPLTICLPAEECYQAQYAPARHRVMGDPGTTEEFLLPKHIYYFVMRHDEGTWKVWYSKHETPQAEDWEKKHYTGLLHSTGDSIYEYTREAHLLLDKEIAFEGRVYAIASAVDLRFNDGKTFEQLDKASMDLDDVLGLTFSATPESVQKNIQHIYTSPYNYTINGDYYAAFHKLADRMGVKYVRMMLYHVASKVDIKWNVAADKRIDNETPANGVRLTYMGVRRLYNGDAYCFKPMRNTLPSLPSSGGYDLPDIVTESDEGLWWEGRTYFYTIPYTVEGAPEYFPVQMVLRTNGITSGTGYELTLKQAIDTANVFVPWMRGNFNLSKALGNTSAEKVTD